MHFIIALALWAMLLAAAPLYTGQARNPQTRPLAAYLIFAALFTLVAAAIFAAIVVVVTATGHDALLAGPLAMSAVLVVMFVPAFAVARWQLRKPPGRPERPDP
jgi:hypothetical protein